MSDDARKETARRALEIWASATPFAPDALIAPGYRNHQEPMADGGVRTIDAEAWKAVVRANHAAFPDLRVEILGQIAEGDTVATHWRFSASHTGPYEGHAPTGRPVRWSGMSIDRFVADGRIAESWVVWDKYSQFAQLGLLS